MQQLLFSPPALPFMNVCISVDQGKRGEGVVCGNYSRKESAAGNFCLERDRLEVCSIKGGKNKGKKKEEKGKERNEQGAQRMKRDERI